MKDFLDLLLPIAISIIMLGIGLGLTKNDFKRVFVQPKAVLFGLFGQMILMPLIGFLITFIFPMDPVYKLGIILLAASPGGTSSNIVTYLLKGRVALAVSITAFNSLLIVFTIPIILNIGFYFFWDESLDVSLSFIDTSTEVGITILLPVILGIIIRHNWPNFTAKLQKPLRYILPTILFIVFALVLLVENDASENNILDYSYLLL